MGQSESKEEEQIVGTVEQVQPAQALRSEFIRCIQRLKKQFEQVDLIDEKFMLVEAKETWQKQHDNISDIYMKLCVDHLENDKEIMEGKEDIENQHEIAKKKLLQKLNQLTEVKKTNELYEIKIPFFNGNVEEGLSFHDLFEKLVHKNKAESNNAAAWELQNQQLGNRRMQFESLIDRIIQQPNVSSNNAAMMKSLHDVTNECMQGLRTMKCNIEGADAVIARIAIKKLDNEGLILYEQHTKKSKEIQGLSDFLEFIEEQYQSLEFGKSRNNFNNDTSNEKQRQQTNAMTVSTDKQYCLYCEKGGHTTELCREFLALEVKDRLEWAKITKTCFLCLTHKFTYNCLSKSPCSTCGMAHHNILHMPSVSTSVKRTNNGVLLPTAQVVHMMTEKGESIALKVVIGQESNTIFFSEE